MASSDLISFSAILLECSVCRGEFHEDNLPRILPCSHVYCTTCLAELARNPTGTITCPACRQKHQVMVEKLIICRTTMNLREMNNTQRKKREAELQEQRSDRSDSASTSSGQAQSASQTSGTDIQGLLTSLKDTMWEASQSGTILERAINRTHWRREILSQTLKAAKQTVTDRMDQVIKAATERKQQLHQSLDDAFQESLSQLTDIEEDFTFRQEGHGRFCSQMVEKEADLQGDAKADPEKIQKLIKELLDSDFNFRNKISIPLKEDSLDTDNCRYRRILTDVSSWGGIKTEHTTYEVPPVLPDLAARTQHYLAKTKAIHTINSESPYCAARLSNDNIAIGSLGKHISVYDSDFKSTKNFSLAKNVTDIAGMCVTPNGKLCISNPDLNTVHVVAAGGRVESSFKTCPPPLARSFKFCPEGMACNKEGEVFVCDWASHVVRVFDQSGQECRRFGGEGEEPGKLRNPWDVAVTPDGKVAVADTENHRIQLFNGTTGRSLATFGSWGSGPNQLDGPTGIAIDSMGFVAVAEAGNKRVQLFTPSGKSFHIIKNEEDPFSELWGIAITKDNDIVICDYWRNRVQVF